METCRAWAVIHVIWTTFHFKCLLKTSKIDSTCRCVGGACSVTWFWGPIERYYLYDIRTFVYSTVLFLVRVCVCVFDSLLTSWTDSNSQEGTPAVRESHTHSLLSEEKFMYQTTRVFLPFHTFGLSIVGVRLYWKMSHLTVTEILIQHVCTTTRCLLIGCCLCHCSQKRCWLVHDVGVIRHVLRQNINILQVAQLSHERFTVL